MMATEITVEGCPCGRTCCDDPEPERGHELFCDCGRDYCDFNWWVRCSSCGAQCGCDV